VNKRQQDADIIKPLALADPQGRVWKKLKKINEEKIQLRKSKNQIFKIHQNN
jgi:hypothetical protein